MTLPSASFLVTSFHEFYEEVLRLKEKALREGQNSYADIDIKHSDGKEEDETGNDDETSLTQNEDTEQNPPSSFEENGGERTDVTTILCQNIQRRLRIFLEELALKASYQLGNYAQSNFKEAHYVMASMADEVFLNLSWPGRELWKKNLLESQLYHSQVAGELFFTRMEKLLEVSDPARVELAIIYLEALNLGFRGQLRGEDADEKIHFYKKQLFYFIHHRDSDLFSPGRKLLINAPYDHNLSLPPPKALPDIRSWLLTFSGIALTYLFITYVLWYRLVGDLNESLEYILEQARVMPL